GGFEPDRGFGEPPPEPLARALAEVVADPTPSEDAPAPSWREDTAAALRKPLLAALERRRATLLRRLGDFERARADAGKAEHWQRFGDLLLAYAHQLPEHAERAVLEDWESGEPIEIALDPALSPRANAQRYYRRAQRARARAERADREEVAVRSELAELEREIERVQSLPLTELQRLHREARREVDAPVGLRRSAPGGFEVRIGRNRKENDWLTRSARSDDVWLHAQGVPGSHVILRTGGKSPPLEALLYAARLAAYHSKARGEKNVPVDYTLKKHVWRPKGAAPGEVLYTQAKTLFVNAEPPEDA
ncbi:NFACT RNA binding domain-containing protein, partial [Oceanithermus sp.]